MSFFKSLWDKILGNSAPRADIRYVDGQMKVKSYNRAFVDNLRIKLGDLTDGLSDQEVIQLFADREAIENEEPRLDVTHSGITEDGRIKMHLDWNTAFIRHLADNGIIAETEDEAVQQYLSLLTHRVSEDMLPDGVVTREDVDLAFRDIEEETNTELEVAAQQVAEQAKAVKRSRARRKKTV